MGFATICRLARRSRLGSKFLSIWLACLLHASVRPSLASTPFDYLDQVLKRIGTFELFGIQTKGPSGRPGPFSWFSKCPNYCCGLAAGGVAGLVGAGFAAGAAAPPFTG